MSDYYLPLLWAAMQEAPDDDARVALAEVVAAAPSSTMDDIRVKLRVLRFCRGGDEALETPPTSTDERIVRGLLLGLEADGASSSSAQPRLRPAEPRPAPLRGPSDG